jgi:phage terminase small subunit
MPEGKKRRPESGDDCDLTAKQRRFVEEFLIDCNATQAAIRAGYSAKTAASQAAQNLIKLNVATAIAEGQRKLREATGITAERVINELAKIAFSDIRKAIDWKVDTRKITPEGATESYDEAFNAVFLKDADELDDATAAAIASVTQTDKGAVNIKFHDKRAALVDLGKHLGIFKDKVELTGKDGSPLSVVHKVERTVVRPQHSDR